MKVSPVKVHGRDRWRVTWRAMGKTRRRFFEKESDAYSFASSASKDIVDSGRDWASLPALDRLELLQCWARAKDKGYTILEACRHFETGGPATDSRISVLELVTRFVASRTAKKLRPESLRILQATLNQFKAGRETKNAAAVTGEEVTAWMDAQDKWGPWRRRGAIIYLTSLFNWAIEQKLLTASPMAGIERPIFDETEISVLTPKKAAELLQLCRKGYKSVLAGLVLGLFSGLRAEEIEKLSWQQVGPQYVDLRSSQAKKRKRRLVPIRPTLAAWLDLCRKKSGPICSPLWKYRKLRSDLRTAVGGVPRNVFRHCFISYAIGAGESVKDVALESGNSEDVIFQRYREVVTPEQAKEFWDMTPDLHY